MWLRACISVPHIQVDVPLINYSLFWFCLESTISMHRACLSTARCKHIDIVGTGKSDVTTAASLVGAPGGCCTEALEQCTFRWHELGQCFMCVQCVAEGRKCFWWLPKEKWNISIFAQDSGNLKKNFFSLQDSRQRFKEFLSFHDIQLKLELPESGWFWNQC